MESNVKKCEVMNFGRSRVRPKYRYKMGNEELKIKSEEKDV